MQSGMRAGKLGTISVGTGGAPPSGLRRTAAAAACAAAVVAVLTGCSNGAAASRPAPPPAAAPSANASADAKAAATAQVLAAYRGWRAAEQQVLNSNRGDSAAMGRYSAGQALSTDVSALGQDVQLGVIFRGAPQLHPSVTAIDPAAGTAQIRDCFDGRNWKAVVIKTGADAAAPGQPLRYVQLVTAQRVDAVWKITNVDMRKDERC